MGFRLPEALAGKDNEVEIDQDGFKRVLEMVAGTAVGAGILAAGAFIYRRIAGVAGAQKDVSNLY